MRLERNIGRQKTRQLSWLLSELAPENSMVRVGYVIWRYLAVLADRRIWGGLIFTVREEGGTLENIWYMKGARFSSSAPPVLVLSVSDTFCLLILPPQTRISSHPPCLPAHLSWPDWPLLWLRHLPQSMMIWDPRPSCGPQTESGLHLPTTMPLADRLLPPETGLSSLWVSLSVEIFLFIIGY